MTTDIRINLAVLHLIHVVVVPGGEEGSMTTDIRINLAVLHLIHVVVVPGGEEGSCM